MSRLLLALLFVYLALALCPEPPHEFGPGYDRSFLLALSEAHAQGVAFGEQLIYPYGPLAYLCRPLPVRDPAGGAIGLGFVLQLGVFALFLLALALLARRVEGRWQALWFVAVIGAACVLDPMALWLSHLEVAVPVVGLLAFATAPGRRLPALLALAALAAALLLVKVDAGVYAIVLCAALSLHTAARCRDDRPAARRSLLAPPAAFLLGLALLYGLESGRLDTLPAFLINSVHVMVGYKEMSADGDPARLVPMLAALGAVFILLPLLVRDRARLAPALLLILVPAFMLWQRVAMRQDEGHQVSLLPRLAVLLLFPLAALQSARDRLLVGALQLLVLVTGGVFVESEFPIYHPDLLARLSGRQALRTAAAIGDWDETARLIEVDCVANGAPLRLGPQAQKIVGDEPVDAVPWELERVVAHRWRWRARPSLQSGNAYSPPLDGLDGRHFEGDEAPRFVLADTDTIDGRHIFLEAPLTWRALLDRYDLRAVFPGVLIVERRSAPRFDAPRPLGRAATGWDQELEVPACDDFVLLSCRVRPGLAGQLAALFYRTTPINLDVRYRSGFEQRWRAVRPNLESGALVSQLPLSREGLRSLFESGPGQTDGVVALRLHTDAPWQYGPELEVQWWALPLREGQRPWRTEQRPPEPVAAESSPLGDGCDDGRRPVLRLAGEPRLGQPLELVVEGARPASVVRLLIGGSPVELLSPSSTLFVDPGRMLLIELAADEAGAAHLGLSVPLEQRLAGLEVTLQAAVANEPGAHPAWRTSCGLRLVIGR